MLCSHEPPYRRKLFENRPGVLDSRRRRDVEVGPDLLHGLSQHIGVHGEQLMEEHNIILGWHRRLHKAQAERFDLRTR
jgi:hypothetical protein